MNEYMYSQVSNRLQNFCIDSELTCPNKWPEQETLQDKQQVYIKTN